MVEHKHPNQKAVLNRLARAEGHIRSVRKMIEENRDCPEVLLQLAAIRKAIDNTAKVILSDHLEHCLLHAFEKNSQDKVIRELNEALRYYLR